MVIKEKIMKPYINKGGYIMVSVKQKGSQKGLFLHRVKAIIFLPNPNSLPLVNHIDGNPLNCELSNLEWCDDSYNVNHAYRLGLNVSRKGTEHHKAILDDEKVRAIRKKYIRGGIYGATKLAKEFNVAVPTINDILRGRRWKHVI